MVGCLFSHHCEVVETDVSMPKAILTKVDEMGRDLLLDFFV